MKLTPVQASDAEWVGDAVESWQGTLRWDIRDRTPGPQLIWRRLWDGVAVQRVVVDGRGQPVALAQAVGLDLHHGVAEVAVLIDSDWAEEIGEPLGTFVELVLRGFPLRKLMFWASDDAAGVATCVSAVAQPVAHIPEQRRRTPSLCVGVTLFEARWRSLT